MQEKPHWMKDHEEADTKNFERIDTSLNEIKGMLEPIAETYRTVATMGKWGKLFLGFVLLLFSVVIAFKSLFKHSL